MFFHYGYYLTDQVNKTADKKANRIDHEILMFQNKNNTTTLNNLFKKKNMTKMLSRDSLLPIQNSIKDMSRIQKTERHDGHGHVD